MRYKSKAVGGFQIFAVAGTNTVSFGIDFDPAKIDGMMGFAIEREDPDPGDGKKAERYYVYGFKVFESIFPKPDPTLQVLTCDHPVQSFVWDDFTANADHEYIYYFHPLKGTPKNLDRSMPPIPIRVKTEPAFSNNMHDVFFNRGVASSQAYARRFKNKRPDQLDDATRDEALHWLARDIDTALQKFIESATAADTLLGAFYEFHYAPALGWLKAAVDRGVDVKLVIDAKKNGSTDTNGKVVHKDFPRKVNMDAVAAAQLPNSAIACWRENNSDAIAHNKFLVLLKGAAKTPSEVWTGSMNLSDGGVHGQTNVGHWVRDQTVAAYYQSYWTLLSGDPGKQDGQTQAQKNAAMKDLRTKVAALLPTETDWTKVAQGVMPVFSPRAGSDVLDMYAGLLDKPNDLGCITLAFGISAVFKSELVEHKTNSPLTFLMLEKKDASRKTKADPNAAQFVALGWKQNVYSAWGSYIRDPLYQWTHEINAEILGLNTHVSYIHSKFLLHDPLGNDPITVTGSANFSDASTNDNDENMLVIRGDKRVADIYLTEFNRLFFHYYFRSVHEEVTERKNDAPPGLSQTADDEKASLFLSETSDWTKKYKAGSLKIKRVQMFVKMAGAVQL